MVNLNLSENERNSIINYVLEKLKDYYKNTEELAVAPELNVSLIRDIINKQNLEKPDSKEQSIAFIIEQLTNFAVHTPHPMYYGLFNPRSNMAGILADLITAVFNPQMAAWSHSPFAAEVERHIIIEFGKKFGYPKSKIDGVFGAGGAEANLTAMLCAINYTFPEFVSHGLFSMAKRPIVYCSSESHHSILKAARTIGLGDLSVVEISVDAEQKMDLASLTRSIQNDLNADNHPFMVVGTAGTTGSGAIDSLHQISAIAKKYGLWFHADAAYGGAAILNEGLMNTLEGIELSDSITFDAHKWLSVPMGASLFLTSHIDILYKAFRIETEYMPKEGRHLEITDPYAHSIQWSRRFIGLKLYLSLLFFGWEGYSEIIGHQNEMGEALRNMLISSGWKINNTTPFPIVCFSDSRNSNNPEFVTFVCESVIKSGMAWLSVYPINGEQCLRACITNYDTEIRHVEKLVTLLNESRLAYPGFQA